MLSSRESPPPPWASLFQPKPIIPIAGQDQSKSLDGSRDQSKSLDQDGSRDQSKSLDQDGSRDRDQAKCGVPDSGESEYFEFEEDGYRYHKLKLYVKRPDNVDWDYKEFRFQVKKCLAYYEKVHKIYSPEKGAKAVIVYYKTSKKNITLVEEDLENIRKKDFDVDFFRIKLK